jgi:N-formylmaleamate deformylase
MGKPTNWIENTIQLSGTILRYHRTGGQKPVLIMLHGITDNGLCWTRVAQELEKDYDIIMPDARGHGKSVPSPIDYRLESMADDIAELIQKLHLDPPILLGHSMGGQTATLVAGKYPTLVSKIMLEDPAYPLIKGSWMTKFLVRLLFTPIIKKNMNSTEEEIRKLNKKMNPSWVDADVGPWVNAQMEFTKNDPLGLIKKINMEVNWHDIFPKIQVPTLLIIPSKGILRLKTAQKILPEFLHAKIAYIEKAGHNVRRENYPAFINAVHSFLSEN